MSAHSSSRYSEKMLPVLPIAFFSRHHAEINLVDQLGGLQGVVVALTLHQVMRQSPQVWEYQGEKLIFGLATPCSPPVQKERDVSHGFVHRAQQDVAEF